jgi:hypothetical protein
MPGGSDQLVDLLIRFHLILNRRKARFQLFRLNRAPLRFDDCGDGRGFLRREDTFSHCGYDAQVHDMHDLIFSHNRQHIASVCRSLRRFPRTIRGSPRLEPGRRNAFRMRSRLPCFTAAMSYKTISPRAAASIFVQQNCPLFRKKSWRREKS